MASTTAINGFPIPDPGDGPNGAAQITSLGNALDLKVPAKFASAGARDSVITSPAEGMRCYITGSGNWEYDGSAWVPSGPRTSITRTYSGSIGAASTSGVSITGVHGQTFTMNRQRSCQLQAYVQMSGDTANDLWRMTMGVDGAILLLQGVIDVAGGGGQPIVTGITGLFTLTAGTHTITCQISRTNGSGTVSVVNITISVLDLGPA